MIGLMLVPFWSAPIETVLAELAARRDGLTQIEADRQLLRFGPNRSSATRISVNRCFAGCRKFNAIVGARS
jgi:Cation transporter/ATPase, N-terminus